MSTISEHIFGLYNQLVDDEIQPIDETVVDDAIGVINKISVSDADSLFYFLAAMNLLNAAIKTAKHKSQLFYGFIKARNCPHIFTGGNCHEDHDRHVRPRDQHFFPLAN